MHTTISITSTGCTLPPISDLFLTSHQLDWSPQAEEMARLSMPSTPCHAVFRPSSFHQPLKAKRKRASPSQLSVLNHVFSQTSFPSTELRIELGKQLGMSQRTVQIWFQNKRQSLRARERHTEKSFEHHAQPTTPTALASPVERMQFHSAGPHHSSTRISLPPLRRVTPTPPPLSPTWSASSTSSSPAYPSPISIDSLLYRD